MDRSPLLQWGPSMGALAWAPLLSWLTSGPWESTCRSLWDYKLIMNKGQPLVTKSGTFVSKEIPEWMGGSGSVPGLFSETGVECEAE